MDSPRFRRTKPKFSSLPLVFERQILTLDRKVMFVLSLMIFRSSFVYEQGEKSLVRIFRRGLMLLGREIIRYFDEAISIMKLCDGVYKITL